MPAAPQPLRLVDPLADPVGQRADGGDAELHALEIVHRLDRRVVADHHRHVLRHAVHHGHRLGRDALGHEGHAGAAADADVGAVGGQAPAAAWRRRPRPKPRSPARAWRRCRPAMPTSSGVKVQANATALTTRIFSAAPAGAATSTARQQTQQHGTVLAWHPPRSPRPRGLWPKSLQKTVTYAMHHGRGALTRNSPPSKIVESPGS